MIRRFGLPYLMVAIFIILLPSCTDYSEFREQVSIRTPDDTLDESTSAPAKEKSQVDPEDAEQGNGFENGVIDEDGFILYVPFDAENQAIKTEISIIDPRGNNIREVELPGLSYIANWARTCHSQHALGWGKFDGRDSIFLIDPNEGLIQNVGLPRFPTELGGESGDCWKILFDTGRRKIYFINTATGLFNDFYNLVPPGDSLYHISATVSMDENYLVLQTSNGSFLVSTSTPTDFRILGEIDPRAKQSYGGSFSSDSKWIAYTQLDRANGVYEIIVESLDGKESRSVLSEQWRDGGEIITANFVPYQEKLIISREDSLSILNLNQEIEHELLRFPFPSLRSWVISPSGRYLILAYGDMYATLWNLIDLQTHNVESLEELSGFILYTVSFHGGKVLNVSERRYHLVSGESGSDRDILILDLETGQVHHVLDITEGTRIDLLDASPSGDYYLVTTFNIESRGSLTELWLLRPENGTAQKLGETGTARGSISPSGNWIVVSKCTYEDSEAQCSLVRISTSSGQAVEIDEGISPILLAP